MIPISKKDKERILQASEGRLLDVIRQNVSLSKKGAAYHGTCPACGSEKGFEYNDGKKIFKCFKCDFGGNSPVAFYMKQGKTYPEALYKLAEQFNIYIEPTDTPVGQVKKKQPKPAEPPKQIPFWLSDKAESGDGGKVKFTAPQKKDSSYCKRMLSESGLSFEDVQAKTFNSDTNHTTTIGSVFRPGTVSSQNQIIPGDDVIIEYYDLEGLPVMYEQMLKGKATGKMKEYFRVRWQFPDEHLDKNGRPFKYKSPSGSGSFIYIPQKIRDIYKEKGKIHRLFIQEGEKKAEKACKHGIPSVAISGIHNLGRNGRLHEDLVKLIQACEVKELILLFDNDWNNISSNLGINDFADQRPRSFFTAAKNFKEYAVQLKNSRSIYLEIYIGHVQLANTQKVKGIDDLLAITLKGNESALKSDVDYLINERSLKGAYIQLYKITTWADSKLLELWSLHNASEFAEKHKDILSELPEFRIGKYRWRFNDEGQIESAQPIESEEKYWEEIEKEDRAGNKRTEYKFRYERCFRFLQNRGFFRFKKPDGDFEYIRIDNPVIHTIDRHEDIRDFVKDFTREIANEEVLEMLHRGGPQFLGPEKLSNLQFFPPAFEEPRRDKQLFYFQENYWEVSADGIKESEYASITHQIWRDQIHEIKAKRTEPLILVKKEDNGTFSYAVSATGAGCHFLKFLINASNFVWRKERSGAAVVENADGIDESTVITRAELAENRGHLVSKLCAIGYMLMTAKDRSVSKAVVAMDGKQSEVGKSNGRSGKSLIGEMFRQVMPAIYINGKHKDIEGDNFLWDEMTVKTKAVFIDDVRTNFPFEFLFANITGDWSVNYKGNRRATFPFQQSPKIYLTTNHALNGEGSSFTDRQWKIAFSDYYNDAHKPVDDFGVLFFDEWDFEQWNLLWNLLAECVQLYLIYGVVQAPMERIEQRELRQLLGEGFILWADEYFSEPTHLNTRISRREISDSYSKDLPPNQQKFNTPQLFKTKIKKYCEYRNYVFNPHKYDPITGKCMFLDKDGNPNDDDKSGGVEYFTIGYKEENKPF